jgi:hypothetical protein
MFSFLIPSFLLYMRGCGGSRGGRDGSALGAPDAHRGGGCRCGGGSWLFCQVVTYICIVTKTTKMQTTRLKFVWFYVLSKPYQKLKAMWGVSARGGGSRTFLFTPSGWSSCPTSIREGVVTVTHYRKLDCFHRPN